MLHCMTLQCFFKSSNYHAGMFATLCVTGNVTGNGEEKLRPFRVMPLYSGGTFDKNYNKRYQPIKFPIPASTKKVTDLITDRVKSFLSVPVGVCQLCVCFQVELYAVITAHGSDDNRCGEFCVTSHHFVFNSVFNNSLVFDSAGGT